MPRRRRPDLEPEILLADVREQERRANRAIDPGYNAKVRRRDEMPINDGFMPILDEKQRRLAYFKEKGVRFDEGLLAFMMERCDRTRIVPVHDADGNQLVRDGRRVFLLRRVGCRVYMTQEEIAKDHGCSRQHVNEQIQLMKEHDFIVNWGHGWYEFDASLCWRGDLPVRREYAAQQRVRD